MTIASAIGINLRKAKVGGFPSTSGIALQAVISIQFAVSVISIQKALAGFSLNDLSLVGVLTAIVLQLSESGFTELLDFQDFWEHANKTEQRLHHVTSALAGIDNEKPICVPGFRRITENWKLITLALDFWEKKRRKKKPAKAGET